MLLLPSLPGIDPQIANWEVMSAAQYRYGQRLDFSSRPNVAPISVTLLLIVFLRFDSDPPKLLYARQIIQTGKVLQVDK